MSKFKVTLVGGAEIIVEADYATVDSHNNLVFKVYVANEGAKKKLTLNASFWNGYQAVTT